MIKNILKTLTLLAVCAAGPLHADPAELSVAQIGIACNLQGGNEEAQMRYRYMCLVPIRSYVDGFKKGAARGLRTAFIEDAKNMATTQGIADLQNRIGVLRRKSECLPPAATTAQIADVFVKYSLKQPGAISRDFGTVLGEAIEDYFCPA